MSQQKRGTNSKVKPSDEELCKIISKSIAQVLRLSLNEDFREKSLKVLEVSSTNQAEEQINLGLASIIGNNSCHRSSETKNQNEGLLAVDSIESSNSLDLLNSSHDVIESTNLEEDPESCDVANENPISSQILYAETNNTRNQSDASLSTESIQETLIYLSNGNNQVTDITSFDNASENVPLADQMLVNSQTEEILRSQNLLDIISTEELNFSQQLLNSQTVSVSGDQGTELRTSNRDTENNLGDHSEPFLLSESEQSTTNSQTSSLSQEMFEKNWLEISSKRKKEKRLPRDFKERRNEDSNYFLNNSQEMLYQDMSLMDHNILSSNSQDLLEEELSSDDVSEFRKVLKRNEQNFLEANMKRQKTQNFKFNLFMDS